MKEKQSWASEKPKLVNARDSEVFISLILRLRNFKEIIKNSLFKLEVPAALTMPCKRTNSRQEL